jgi:hypothetical protein
LLQISLLQKSLWEVCGHSFYYKAPNRKFLVNAYCEALNANLHTSKHRSESSNKKNGIKEEEKIFTLHRSKLISIFGWWWYVGSCYLSSSVDNKILNPNYLVCFMLANIDN